MIVANSNAMYDGEFPIERSLRFNAASSQTVNRTFPTSGDRTKWTYSLWVKRGLLGTFQDFLSTSTFGVGFYNDDSIFYTVSGVGNQLTTAKFRDVGAWYHFVFSVDTTQAVASDRLKLYVNNVLTSFTSNPISLNYQTGINSNVAHVIGSTGVSGGTTYTDGYLTNIHFIDGQTLTPDSFGKFNPVTGQWVAKRYTGTYGTNGFYLDFKDGTNTTSLGLDKSGNTNNWTLNNFVRSAGVNDCWMLDVPSGNGNASTVQPSGNYPTLNPLDISTGSKSSVTLSHANLRITANTTDRVHEVQNFPLPINSKIYIEFIWSTLVIGSNNQLIGVGNFQHQYRANGSIYRDNVNIGTYATYGINDVIGMAIDTSANTIQFFKNNVSQVTITPTGVLAGSFIFTYLGANTDSLNVNFGQRSFAYTPPTGFNALCTSNLPVPIIEKGSRHFDILSYTGDGNLARSFSNFEFSPDLVWIKNRGGVSHCLWNSIVGGGTNTALATDRTVSEAGHNADATNGYLTTFDSTGFSVQRGSTGAYTNNNATNYVAWLWNASDTERVYNNKGSIPSFVKSNSRAGFSVVTYTGSGAIGTIGHGLSSPPKLIITKNRGATSGWLIYQSDIGTGFYLTFTSAAKTADTAIWQNMQPTLNSFSVGTSVSQLNNEYIAYCFSEVYGFSKIGSYTGNGSVDGTFVYCGFRPKYILVKRTDAAAEWKIMDASRSPSNVVDDIIYPDLANAEGVNDANHSFDFVSNGFKVRTSHANTNALNGTYIFYAIAENPFQYSNAR